MPQHHPNSGSSVQAGTGLLARHRVPPAAVPAGRYEQRGRGVGRGPGQGLLTHGSQHVVQILLVDEPVAILVDHVEGFLELLDLGLIKHGEDIGGGALRALLGGLGFGTFAGHLGGWGGTCRQDMVTDQGTGTGETQALLSPLGSPTSRQLSLHVPGLSPRAAGTAPHTLGPHTHVLPVLFIPVAGNDGEPNATLGSVWEGTQGCFLGAALGFGAAPPLLEAALG